MFTNHLTSNDLLRPLIEIGDCAVASVIDAALDRLRTSAAQSEIRLRRDLRHLFDAYKQGPARAGRGSLGLGLYIGKALGEAHGGRIGADSSNAGSTFWFEIPRQ